MTGKNQKQEATAVQTPLHLLQVLTRSLNEHLAEACSQAQTDAQKVLDKLERKQQKLAEKLEQVQEKLANGDVQTHGKSPEALQGKLEELTEQLAACLRKRKDAEEYARQLQNDVRQTLRLAKGLERIDLQVTQSIEKRNNPPTEGTKRPTTRRSRSRKPAADAATPPPTTQAQD